MKSICIAAIGLLFFAFTSKDQLTGKWERVNNNLPDRAYSVIFKEDNSYQMQINGIPRLTGTYKLRDGLLTVDDEGCPEMSGTYKLTFFGNGDSCRLEVINDACYGRLQQADNAILARVKKIKL